MASRSGVQQDKLMKALVDIGQELTSTLELDELLDRLLRISREVFCYQNAIIRLVDFERGVLETVASYGYTAEAISQQIHLGQGVMGKAALQGKPVLVEDVRELPSYIPGISGARSELAAPMLVKDKVIGVFSVESHRPGAFAEEDIDPLMTVASFAAIAIDNARLYARLKEMSGRYQNLHQFNRRILQSVNLGIYTVDEQKRITSWNRRMEEMSGLSAEQALGQDVFKLFPSLKEEGFGSRLRRVLRRGEPERLRLLHRNQTGQLRMQKRRLAPLKEGERTVGVVVIVEDITEFKRLLDQTIQSEKLAEIGRLTAGIAHEINNPLAVLSYAAQLLRREEGLSAFQREMVERVESEVERLAALTGSLLSFSSDRDTRLRQVDVNEIVQDVLRLMRHEMQRQMIRLDESYGELTLIQADPNKLKQVLINLVMNAVQAMEGVGTLTITTRMHGEGEVEILVQDTGPGIPPSVQQRIFEPFFTTKKEGEGSGLGLYICRNILLEHKGRLAVASEPGQGTTFTVTLPSR
ncbi:MAG: ATP-binding protein [Desulfuromonadales bacterium]|nr:ATP-binding protein [Desulfuromonadales bacterium]MDW7758840.1 ATP-binding protein [Desulfuromonadales bacterium]